MLSKILQAVEDSSPALFHTPKSNCIEGVLDVSLHWLTTSDQVTSAAHQEMVVRRRTAVQKPYETGFGSQDSRFSMIVAGETRSIPRRTPTVGTPSRAKYRLHVCHTTIRSSVWVARYAPGPCLQRQTGVRGSIKVELSKVFRLAVDAALQTLVKRFSASFPWVGRHATCRRDDDLSHLLSNLASAMASEDKLFCCRAIAGTCLRSSRPAVKIASIKGFDIGRTLVGAGAGVPPAYWHRENGTKLSVLSDTLHNSYAFGGGRRQAR